MIYPKITNNFVIPAIQSAAPPCGNAALIFFFMFYGPQGRLFCITACGAKT